MDFSLTAEGGYVVIKTIGLVVMGLYLVWLGLEAWHTAKEMQEVRRAQREKRGVLVYNANRDRAQLGTTPANPRGDSQHRYAVRDQSPHAGRDGAR